MLELRVSAETLSELKQKTFEALGITEPAQGSLRLTSNSAVNVEGIEVPPGKTVTLASVPSPLSPMGAMAQAAAPGRTRRTKAQIEADRQAKNAGAPAAEVIQNNFEANDESAMNAEAEAEQLADEGADLLGEDAAPVAEAINHDTCKALMKQVIDKHGMDRAINIIKRFKVAKVPELPAESLEMFTFACKDALK